MYIEFKRDINSNLPGKISYPVYRSIKMRQVGIRIQIPLLPYVPSGVKIFSRGCHFTSFFPIYFVSFRALEAQKRAEVAGIGTYKLSNLGKLKNSVRTYLPNKSKTFLEFNVSWVMHYHFLVSVCSFADVLLRIF